MKKILVIIFFVVLAQCSIKEQKLQPIEQARILMDTFVQIVVYDQNRPTDELEQIIDLAFDRMREIDRITNIYDEVSLISAINKNAGNNPVEIDSVLQKLIIASNNVSELSAGAFDITIETIKRLWNFSSESPGIPDSIEINDQLKYVNFQNIILENKKISFKLSGVKIDLGAIAKGYAIDEAIKVLLQHGIKDAMVNAGGDLRAICSSLTSDRRRVWIKHPRIADSLYGYFKMDNGSVATSGDYERYFIKDSTRYHHVLNPKTGYPARDCVSVTIQTKSAMMADALATAVFVLGIKKGMDLINRLPDVEGIILFKKEKKLCWKASAGLDEKFKIN